MNRNGNRTPSPRHLSTVHEITEDNQSTYDPDRSSIRTFSTSPFPPDPTSNPNIPRNAVYIGEVPQVVPINRLKPPEVKPTWFQQAKQRWWFWPSIVIALVIIGMVIVTTLRTIWVWGHSEHSIEVFNHTMTIYRSETIGVPSCAAGQCTSTSGPSFCIVPVATTTPVSWSKGFDEKGGSVATTNGANFSTDSVATQIHSIFTQTPSPQKGGANNSASNTPSITSTLEA